LAAAAVGRPDFLHEEDSEDEEDSHDEDDEQQQQQQILSMNQKKQQLFTSRSFSASVFYHKKHHQYEQESSKKSLYHSHHQDRNTKNIIGNHDSASTLDTYEQTSINTMLTSSYPSVSLGKYFEKRNFSLKQTSFLIIL
jgi:hypothetical protein